MKPALMRLIVLGISLSMARSVHAWISYLDFNDSQFPTDPWIPFINDESGPGAIVDLGGGNFALRLSSPDHSAEDPPSGTYYNEYYDERFGETDIVGAARFRLTAFTPTGKENLLSVAVGGDFPNAPAITLVDGNYWVWSYTTDEQILDLGPAVANEWHEAYVLASNDGTAKVWWDGEVVLDGPAPTTPNLDGYIEFGSGTYWQTGAGTTVDFDWVGSGELTDLPVSAADFDEDGGVDAADLALWKTGFGDVTAAHMDGDADADADVDGADFLIWQRQLNVAGIAAIPEPATPYLLISGMFVGMLNRRRRLARHSTQTIMKSRLHT
jgi:hypothetical protein